MMISIILLLFEKAYNKMLKHQIKEELPAQLLSKDKKLNDVIYKQHHKRQTAQQRNKLDLLLHNFQPGFLEPEYEGDQTVKVKQEEIRQAVNLQTASNAFELQLEMGSYRCNYSRNGSTLMLTSNQGHLALLDWREKNLSLELNLKQAIGESTFLHSDQMLALCQPHNTFIYDSRGIQLHKLPQSLGVQYLPYHFLLTLYDNRKLKYYDTTTGHIVADHIAKNNYTVMTQNKSNAVIAMGTSKGVVQWWTPGVGNPAVQLFVGSKVDSIAFYKGYMYTLTDSLKIWDSRMLKLVVEQPLQRRAKSITTSDSGLVSINYGFKAEMFKDIHLEKQSVPYLRHNCSSQYHINNLQFVPFEDLAGIGHNKGFASIIVPGSGVPIYDTHENNPFETKKQRRQSLVHKLLEKLPPQTITVDPNILGGMSRFTKEQLEAEEKAEQQRKQREHLQKVMSKRKMKGRNKISKKLNKKEIEMDKIKRAELTKIVNSRLWAKRAERKKRQSQMSLIEQMQAEGLGVADLVNIKPHKHKGKEEEEGEEDDQ